ncbi:MAG: hypothetical protein Q7R33_02920 [Nitrosarchaeum sp.]|nr:hypothetical protein [Nitrosarchaeum sp.]
MIKEAAILKDGKVYTGRRHHNIIHEHPFMFKCENSIQGFVTDDGKFLNREEAMLHAFNCGQIAEKKIRLYSEDLY